MNGAAPNGDWGSDDPIIDSQDELDALERRMIGGPDLGPIDFDNYVLIGTYALVEPTCGARLVADGLYDETTLAVRIEDTSGARREVTCDYDTEFIVLYQVPRPVTDPVVCIEYLATCLPELW